MSLCGNVLAEYLQRKFAGGYARREYVPAEPKDEEGAPLDLDGVIARAGTDRHGGQGGRQ